MELILLKDVEKLGYADDVVSVKAGYGLNYLIPQKYAIIANKTNLAVHNSRMSALRKIEEGKINQYKELASKIEGQTLEVVAKAGTSGKIFGSVTNVHVASAIKDKFGFEVERKKVKVADIKNLGEYPATVDFYDNVKANFTLKVIGDEN